MDWRGNDSDTLHWTGTGIGNGMGTIENNGYIYVSLQLRVQNVVSAQPCVEKLGISLVLLNFLHCNFRLWFKTT